MNQEYKALKPNANRIIVEAGIQPPLFHLLFSFLFFSIILFIVLFIHYSGCKSFEVNRKDTEAVQLQATLRGGHRVRAMQRTGVAE